MTTIPHDTENSNSDALAEQKPPSVTEIIEYALLRSGKKCPRKIGDAELETAVLDICNITAATRAAYFDDGLESGRDDYKDIVISLANNRNKFVVKSDIKETPGGGSQEMANTRIVDIRRDLQKHGLGILCVIDFRGLYTGGKTGRNISYYRIVKIDDVPNGKDGKHSVSPLAISKERDDHRAAVLERKRNREGTRQRKLEERQSKAGQPPPIVVDEVGQSLMFADLRPARPAPAKSFCEMEMGA